MPAVKKKLYKITWDKIAPPYTDYKYFEGCSAHPFRHAAVLFDIANAWWLIEASSLVYADKEFAIANFKKAGFSRIKPFEKEGTECFVVSNNTFAFVVFRGTETRSRKDARGFQNIIDDVTTDLNITLVNSGKDGRVHKGFKGGLDQIWPSLKEYLESMPVRYIWFTGHSLGAALATLAADRYGNAQGLYTFGSPRVGNADFKANFVVNAFRFVNSNDIVTRIPPDGFYKHVGCLKYIDRSGTIHDNIGRRERFADQILGKYLNILGSIGKLRNGFSAFEYIPAAIENHVPLHYAVHIWNSLLDA